MDKAGKIAARIEALVQTGRVDLVTEEVLARYDAEEKDDRRGRSIFTLIEQARLPLDERDPGYSWIPWQVMHETWAWRNGKDPLRQCALVRQQAGRELHDSFLFHNADWPMHQGLKALLTNVPEILRERERSEAVKRVLVAALSKAAFALEVRAKEDGDNPATSLLFDAARDAVAAIDHAKGVGPAELARLKEPDAGEGLEP